MQGPTVHLRLRASRILYALSIASLFAVFFSVLIAEPGPTMKMEIVQPIQFAAIPFRREPGGVHVLLVTSRETRRWVLPKGWPAKRLPPHESAAREALEEAGVRGVVSERPAGEYVYFKRMRDHFMLCSVLLYPLEVTEQLATWKEKGQRELAWTTPENAALMVDEPDLGTILRTFPGLVDRDD
jgi:8-oxo-dGTP pyrophosphatase MutT (NUDIX family)